MREKNFSYETPSLVTASLELTQHCDMTGERGELCAQVHGAEAEFRHGDTQEGDVRASWRLLRPIIHWAFPKHLIWMNLFNITHPQKVGTSVGDLFAEEETEVTENLPVTGSEWLGRRRPQGPALEATLPTLAPQRADGATTLARGTSVLSA